MKSILLSAVALLLFPIHDLSAHPATGIVVDRKGNVYFSDLETVWKMDLQGKRTIFREGIRGRHVHELSIDGNDNIYGADISYKPATSEWVSSVWKMTPSGELTYLIESTTAPPRGASMWLDRHGNMYQVDQNNHLKERTLLLRRSTDGVVTVVAGGSYGQADGKGSAARFSSVGGMFVGADDNIYLSDSTSVRKVASDGTVTTLARELDFKTAEDDPRLFASQGGLAGLTVDSEQNVYVADAGRRRLLKIDRQGQVSVVLRSAPPYFPNGVAAVGGNLYVLEVGLTLPNATSPPRVRKTTSDGKAKILGSSGETKDISLAMLAGVTAERGLFFLIDNWVPRLIGVAVIFPVPIIWLKVRRP